MKTLVVATAALMATTGLAAAEVAVSGDGRLGVTYNGADLNFASRIRVAFDLSGQTDGGLTFGGSFRADNAPGAANGSDGSIFIEGAFGRLEMGNTVGAAEAVIGDLPEVGFTDISDLDNDVTFITGDETLTGPNNPVALYTYTSGGLTFALSMNDGIVGNGSVQDSQEYALGAKYEFGDYALALGYEVSDPPGGPSAKHLILGATANVETTTLQLVYGEGSGAIKGFRQIGFGVSGQVSDVTINAYVRDLKVDAGSNAETQGGMTAGSTRLWGVGAEYELGGGASVAGGVAQIKGAKARADLGIKFSF
ncbi:MAG TPA: porin [Paracoccaceae bacterium]|nr:porin [Paracoccaceae bacterium]HMO70835.1 porin [Paracoccaceae bacterium]